jgi:hypothetical protein
MKINRATGQHREAASGLASRNDSFAHAQNLRIVYEIFRTSARGDVVRRAIQRGRYARPMSSVMDEVGRVIVGILYTIA